ncbi:MAG: ATP-binding cassette domain-containing protein [Succinivibrio sp.]|nr:ATP-binding cassette domain-containing protein [Succinivibrio sp.]MDD7286376.1 ATP-binding cassette domain-containing protein [Succinivibrio sp.]MDY5187937.1 ATP-binding cassette domain-containing protein [Succinivibrio sp.]
MAKIIEISALCKSYQTQKRKQLLVFDNFNLAIESDCHLICLTGPDGAGKSTLLKILAGVLPFDKGQVLLNGTKPDMANAKFSKDVGYMSQTLGLYEELTVWDNLTILSGLRGLKLKESSDYLTKLLTSVNLINFKDREAGALSGGMKQKLALCCTIAARPKILILDEPTVGVDPVSRNELWNIILSYLKEVQGYCIFSTAYLEEADFCDLVLMLNDGKLLLQGSKESLLNKLPHQTYSLEDTKDNYQQALKKALQLTFRDDANSPILDICPRLGRIDILTTKGCSLEELKLYLQKHFNDTFKLNTRGPILEDVYIHNALTEQLKIQSKSTAIKKSNSSDTACSTLNNQRSEIVIARNIKKCFGNFVAVDDSSFKVHTGEIFGLLGPNGAGKTTTFRMICALSKPTSGQVTINGFDLAKAKHDARATIGYVSQKFSLYRKLSVYQNLEYFGLSYGLKPKALKERIKELLSEFNLEDFKNINSETLPFGIQRQLSMACALIHKPKILFLDEATSGADPLARRNFWYLINKLATTGTCVVVTTHFMEEAEYCDNFLIQDQGKILVLGSPNTICRKDNKRISIQEKFVSLILDSRNQEAEHA